MEAIVGDNGKVFVKNQIPRKKRRSVEETVDITEESRKC